MKYIFYLLVILVCKPILYAQTDNLPQINVNTKLNRVYDKSKKSFEGTLPPNQYEKMRLSLQRELGTTFSDDLNILVHYEQRGSNCLKLDGYEKALPWALKTLASGKKKLSRKFNTAENFVYNANSFFHKELKEVDVFRLDSGYFKENVFKLNENCSAFFLLKTTGEFMIYYGEDYMGEVYNYLKL